MYIVISMLFVVNIIYVIYIKYVFFSNNTKSFPIQIYIYILFSTIIIWWMVYITDIYYFYLFWETFNIMSYLLLINLSTNVKHYKGVVSYYFLGFIASILFIISIYDITQNLLSFYLINIALVLKFRLYPFSNLVSNVYKNLGYIAFLTISYLLYFQYFVVLIIFNFQCVQIYYQLPNFRLYYIIVIFLCIITTIASVFMFDKQNDVKSFWAYSSILNLPMVIISILSSTLNAELSTLNYTLLLTYLTYYIFFYSTNTFILSVHSIHLKPSEEKR